jgi:hypothetical protein
MGSFCYLNLVYYADGGTVKDELRQKFRGWLKDPDPSKNHNDARQKRQPTTGAWFTEGKQFAQWKKDPHSFFWIQGASKFIGPMSLNCCC